MKKDQFEKPHAIKTGDVNINTAEDYSQFVSKEQFEKALLKKGMDYNTLLGNFIGTLKVHLCLGYSRRAKTEIRNENH